MAEYCTDSDVYKFGLPRGSIPNPARPVASVDTSADAITLDLHGFDTDDLISFRAEGGGSLPAPLDANTTYYAISVDDNRFRVAASAGGAAINLTTAGSRTVVIAEFPIASARAWASRILDDMLPAHAVPLTAPYPAIVVMTAAELAAAKLAHTFGTSSESLSTMVDAAQKRLERWGKGVPIRDANTTTHTNTAASATAPYRDRRGWNRFGGIG